MEKLLFIIPTLGKGGAERIIYDLANNLEGDFNIDVLIISKTNDSAFLIKSLKHNPFYVFEKPVHQNRIIFKLQKLFFLLLLPLYSIYIFFKFRIYSYKLVIYNLKYTGLLSYFFSFFNLFIKHRQQHIEIFHTNLHLLSLFSRFFFFLSFLNKNTIICNISPNEVAKLKRSFIHKKIVYLPFSVHIPDSYQSNNKINSNFLKITSIARLVSEKHLDFFIRACNVLKLNNLNFKYFIYGDGPLKLKLIDLINRLNLSDYIFLMGSTDNPLMVLSQSDMFFVSMVENSTGIAGIQAAHFHIPIFGYQTVKNYKDHKSDLRTFKNFNDLANEVLKLQSKHELIEYKKIVMNYYSKRNFHNFISSYHSFFKGLIEE